MASKKKIDRLESAPDEFTGKVQSLEDKFFTKLIELTDLLTIKDGLVEVSNENIATVERIARSFEQYILEESGYRDALVSHVRDYRIQGELTDEYFASIGKFESKEVYRAMLRESQESAVELLGESSIRREMVNPTKQSLLNSISTNQSFSDTVLALEKVVKTTDTGKGKLTAYVNRVTRDAFTAADRSYTKMIADDLEMQYYRYVGGTVQDSREFCIHRAGKVFTKEEVESWGRIQNWQGRAKGTDESTIFVLAGGHNCMHSILPISEGEYKRNK